MSNSVEIHWTCGSLDEARLLSRYLVQERLVACAQIIPWIESVFTWNGELDAVQETKVIFKTHRSQIERVKQVILENSKYDVPEITVFNIVDGHSAYLEWIEQTVGIS